MRLFLLLLATAVSAAAAIAPNEADQIQALLKARKLPEAESAAQALATARPAEKGQRP